MVSAMALGAQKAPDMGNGTQGYAGSKSCMECHEKFYQLWSTSKHGLAMQPYTAEFARNQLTAQEGSLPIGKFKYRADLAKGLVRETVPKGTKQYRIEHVLGGKNVFYFLTPFPRGRLQTLPVAYDLLSKQWFDTAASGVRHFPGMERDQPVSWKDPGYTFNTGCYNCHVSQLSSNYDLKSDTYKTTWAEPGINCETCHGPSAEHNRVMREAPKGERPKDMKIISVKKFTPEQHNATCSGCHAKMSPITKSYTPGDKFFDHYDIATLEDPDFYPDGRDLGENYTYTSWLMSPCAKAGKLHCVTCHTSSGRYRFKAKEKANEACLPCHVDRVKNASAHTRHKEDGPGNQCISCHMPLTSFARMNRTDHSMRPPTPSATLAYKSPNACNLCHTDRDAAWADRHVRQWHARDYQAPVLKRAALIEEARKRDWKELPAMFDAITGRDRDLVLATSLIRLVSSSGDPRTGPMLLKAMKDPSPLVRGAAAEALQHWPSREAAQSLVTAAGDDYRLVRVRAAASLAGFSDLQLKETEKQRVEAANKEFLASLTARPDLWSSHYNLGNYYLNRNEPRQAISAFDTALKHEPRAVPARVNESIAYARLGENKKADESLKRALKLAPDNAAANFNMGLLKGEQKDPQGAEHYLKKALKSDPLMAQAAYNLCVITARDRINEAVTWCQKAAELRPQEPRYAYTLAFYLNQQGDRNGAVRTLKTLIEKYPGYKEAEMLLKELSK
jgi:tetratricopeptide (TPR) repeat protein